MIDALHTGIFGQLRGQAFAFALYNFDLRGDVAAELAEDFALGGTVEVVGIFDVGKYGGYARVGKSHAHAQVGEAPGLGECLEHYDVGVRGDERYHRREGREVDISLVDSHYAVKTVGQPQDVGGRYGKTGGVVGRAYPYHFGVGVDGRKGGVDRKGIAVGGGDFAIFHIVDGGRY